VLARELSGGWKQRLALGCALLHRPGIVFLDEPTGGTDPLSRRAFWDVINDLSGRGTTVLVTTHYLDEAEYCNDLVLMHGGRIVAQGSPGELKRKAISGSVYEVECADPVGGMAALRREPSVSETAIFGTLLHVSLERDEDLPRALEGLAAVGIPVSRFARIVPSLEDVFIRLIDRHEGGDREQPPGGSR
jgi:ABC-2 type transport system ATP-binding protein